ncbi:tRNA glutamyl-Q(34) synthetase GluQRS [Cohaesibacter celericrescens]|uniref:tRNA glutamyl-Q(34) synthetase GluQRS n=1 Tax=Cohaesibacter celericrescens TaxID=2067669 RepID=A0A2N5XUI3_9HYPH|nr:tRNA glutamyl-Q(34) synthetase GluQRS [Cohaesibacter celericrescens]PLW78078.1 tRNA glutamyl-Q(34) synthetase GluQRS [Cohaesibacter celericrescens]
MTPVFRFAPSPNGALHLGHAFSAIINFEAAKRTCGRFYLRIEDIDTMRCTQDKIEQMLDDLGWLGLTWDQPVLRQSQRLSLYQDALEVLRQKGLIYPSSASRKDIQKAVLKWETNTQKQWPRDPDGAHLFPRALLPDTEIGKGTVAWRLDMHRALEIAGSSLTWTETGPKSQSYPKPEIIPAQPNAWGDVILARKDTPTSYHLSVVIDDAAQDISHVVRGQDLFCATSLHRLLQTLLDLPAPLYHHHRLLTDGSGQKLSKSRGDLGLASLRTRGASPQDIRQLVHWSEDDLKAFIIAPSGL